MTIAAVSSVGQVDGIMKLAPWVSSAEEPGGLLDGVMAANYHKEALKFTLSHLGTLSEAKRIEAERQFMKVRLLPLAIAKRLLDVAPYTPQPHNAEQAIRTWKQNENGKQQRRRESGRRMSSCLHVQRRSRHAFVVFSDGSLRGPSWIRSASSGAIARFVFPSQTTVGGVPLSPSWSTIHSTSRFVARVMITADAGKVSARKCRHNPGQSERHDGAAVDARRRR